MFPDIKGFPSNVPQMSPTHLWSRKWKVRKVKPSTFFLRSYFAHLTCERHKSRDRQIELFSSQGTVFVTSWKILPKNDNINVRSIV